MVKVLTHGQINVCIKDSGKTTKCMARDNLNGLIKEVTLVVMLMIKKKV